MEGKLTRVISNFGYIMSSHVEFAHLKLPLGKIVEATNKFADENLIGQGGFGKVYKGNLLRSGKPTIIAARRLHYDYGQGDLEFWNEISMLASLVHENLVSFIGFCDEKDEKIIIHKLEVNGSLDKYLSSPTLTWMRRLQICVGVAEALNYIHCDEGHESSVIHRNIKSSKILLDEEWKPKLSGFEHSKTNTRARRHRLVLADIIGTIGYVDPTYEKTGFVTHKSDVYSFGVVLFEVLCGKRAFSTDNKEQHSPQFTEQDYIDGKLDEMDGKEERLLKDPLPLIQREFVSLEERLLKEPLPRIQRVLDSQGAPFVGSSSVVGGEPPSIVDTQPSSFVDVKPSSFGGLHSSFVDVKPSSFAGPVSLPASFERPIDVPVAVDRPLLFGGKLSIDRPPSVIGAPELPDDIQPASIISLPPSIGGPPSLIGGWPLLDDIEHAFKHTNESTLPANVLMPSPANVPVLLEKCYSLKKQRFELQPLFTMKRLDQYLHRPNEELLCQLAKSHYEEETLYNMIDPSLREQMDPQSFRIFSETAYNCLKDKRAERPNIDQILINLKNALNQQMSYENALTSNGGSIVSGEVEGTTSKRWKVEHLEHLKIPLADIISATKNFTETYIGEGAFATVYKAQLEVPIEEKATGEISRKWRTVAIKCIRKDGQKRDGFHAEIELVTSCKHDNIVSLLGFCDDGPNMILVYEHASNRSLDSYLGSTDSPTNLTWVQRIKIGIDIAKGLKYIHNLEKDKERRIIHRDIKSENILLGKKWVAKIADFGLSRFHPANQKEKTVYTEHVAGTKYYVCPEYEEKGKLKTAVDIYSFGVVLFEILSGKLAYNKIYVTESEKGIADVARRRFKEGTIHKMVDPKIMEEVDELTSTLHKGPNQDSLRTYLEIALRCLAICQDDRPAAEEVLEELENALSLQENNKDSLQMSLEEIKLATQNFSRKNLIGGGGFGKVFKGEVIRGNETTAIVAKRLDRSQGQGELHFLMELEILFDYKHDNIIGLEGYCNENDEKIIVYEHAPNRSLDRYVNDDRITWTKRLKISIDIARGLAFLHGGAPTKEMVVHRDIKSANILLNAEWKAKISDFGLCAMIAVNQEVISKLVGTIGYVDPLYEMYGFFSEKSDIYSLGVVLFELLYGQLLVPNTKYYDKKGVHRILEQIHDEGKLGSIVFAYIKEQIAPKSLSTFREVVSQCLYIDRKKRPTAEEVLQQLEKSLEFQEDYEIWGPKLPEDYEEILKLSKSPAISYSTESKKDLYNLFSKGILLQDDKVGFSLGRNGERNEMISATAFSYKDGRPHDEWCMLSESRFKKVAEMLDISNLMIEIEIRAQFLSPNTLYGVYLVFKFCDSRDVSGNPVYVDLKYREGSKTLHAYFATWRDDGWMMIEFHRFLNKKEDVIFKFVLESLSPYYCREHDAIYVEGIEFRPIHNARHGETEKSNVDQELRLPAKIEEIYKTSKENDFLGKYIYQGIGTKALWFCNKFSLNVEQFLLSEVNGNKHLMLSAKAALHNFSNLKLFNAKPSAHSRFQEVLELLPQQTLRISCTIKSQMLSQDTTYMCYLVFKLSRKCHGLHSPVEVRDLLQKNKMVDIVYFRSPRPWNIHDITRVPVQRKDGWMEVTIWKFNSSHELKNDSILVNLKLTSYEGSMSGLIVCGLEFRPM